MGIFNRIYFGFDFLNLFCTSKLPLIRFLDTEFNNVWVESEIIMIIFWIIRAGIKYS